MTASRHGDELGDLTVADNQTNNHGIGANGLIGALLASSIPACGLGWLAWNAINEPDPEPAGTVIENTQSVDIIPTVIDWIEP